MFFCITNSYSQSDRVSFIHGLGDNAAVWSTMTDQLGSEFNFNGSNVRYNSKTAISKAASGVYIPSGTVAVAHSMGGLLGREYLRQRGTDRMKALITVRTPHRGAPAARSVQNEEITKMLIGWLDDLLIGPAASLEEILGEYEVGDEGPSDSRTVLDFILTDVGFVLDRYLKKNFDNIASVDNLRPYSPFLNRLNSAPNTTLPSARYAIFGSEDDFEYVRLAESARNKEKGKNPVENKRYVKIHHFFTTVYLLVTARYVYLSGEYFYYYNRSSVSDPLHFFYYNQALKFLAIAREWYRGFASLAYKQQVDWDQKIIGVNYYRDGDNIYKDANDGLLSAKTQVPSFFGSQGDEILRAEGANHVEETTHPSVRERLSEVFRNRDVNIPEKSSGGKALKVTVQGPVSVNDGQRVTFTSKVVNAKGSVRYQWYYRQESYSRWVAAGSNSPTYTRTFRSGPGGKVAQSAVMVKVISGGITDSSIHPVRVYGNGCNNRGRPLGNTDGLIPCN